MKFYTCSNNGVTALVSELVLADINKKNAIRQILNDDDHKVKGRDISEPLSEGLKHLNTKPVFTFVRGERFAKSPWFTGGEDLISSLHQHLTEKCITVQEGWFHVPFSNAAEIGVHGDQARASELSYVTTEQQFIDAFGISIEELLAKTRVFR